MAAVAGDVDVVSTSYSYQEYTKVKCLHTWVIKDFSLISDAADHYINSGRFFKGDISSRLWSMSLYPAYTQTTQSRCLKIEVMYYGSDAVKAACCVWVVNKDCLQVRKQATAARIFSQYGTWTAVLGNRSEFLDDTSCLLSDGVLTLCCELTILDLRKSSAVCTLENPPEGPSFMDDFGRLFEDDDYADVTLIAEGKDFRVHKIILAMRSPVFAAMFRNNMKEKQENRVHLDDISAEALQGMITFIYTDTAPNMASLAVDLLRAAEKYDLKRLKSMCEYSLACSLSVDTVVEMLRLAIKLNADRLRDFAVCYIKAHAVAVGKTDAWKVMVEEEPRLLELFTTVGKQTTEVPQNK
ncbi:speckle-type POZ protein-like [Ornithodoros turicata]|uniref:speckle-type POZ protein-like n=1 Tax=Ornithodoros turicata TaxID=34597 RepID=UPI003138BFBA